MGTSVQTAHILPAPRTGVELDKRAFEARKARHKAEDWLRKWGLSGSNLGWAVPQVVAELVSNAVTHTGEVRETLLAVWGGMLHVTVADGNPNRIPIKEPLPLAPIEADEWSYLGESGRGMGLVAKLADDWGVNTFPEQGYKEVWATFSMKR